MPRMTRLPAILGFLLVLCPAASAQTQTSLARSIEKIMDRPEFAHAIFGVEVYSLDTGKTLYAYNAGKLFVPGSTTKTLTEGTELALLGPEYRFHTKIYRTGSIDADGTLNGDIVLVASGDPNLSGRLQSDGTLAFENADHAYAADMLDAKTVPGDPLEVIDDFARQIATRGIRKITGRVLVDASMFPEGKAEAGSGAIVSPIVVNDNIIDVTLSPGARVGDPAALQVSPQTAYARVVNQVATGQAGSERQVGWGADNVAADGTHAVVLEGTEPLGQSPTLFPYDVPTPSRFAEVVLTEALQRAGVTVHGSMDQQPTQPAALVKFYTPENLIAEHISAPLSEDIKVTLKVSQNLHATMTLYILGAVLSSNHDDSEQAGLDLEHNLLQKAGLDLTQASQAEGAGGPGAFFTPDFMVHYLAFLSRQKYFDIFYHALPILGRDGTLYNLLSDSPAAGRVHAKTGTFTVYNGLNHTLIVTGKGLVGYIDAADGSHLIVAAYVNNVNVPLNFEAVEKVGNALAEIAAAAYATPPAAR
ncbi:MAG: D-alanyl-D-alanine carboxypeptidase/D-alanyl-D-alanine-endopeptidase [Candidatus Acidiferrales bacterium]